MSTIKSCFFFLFIVFIISCDSNQTEFSDLGPIPSNHEEMEDFFIKWRAFLAPSEIDGIPDYSEKNMERQYAELSTWQKQLESIDTSGWPIGDQVDWYIIWAEMNGLQFDHEVKKPWSRDPAFYVWFFSYPTDVPEREGPNAYGIIEYDYYKKPITQEDAVKIASQLRKGPALLEQAKLNLTGNAEDLWKLSESSFREQSEDLEQFSEKMKESFPDLSEAALELKESSDEFAIWIKTNSKDKNGPSGVGKENYSWNLKNVHLLPYTWEEELTLIERELARAHSSLRLEENKNRNLPKWKKMDNKEDFDKALQSAIDDFMAFHEKEEILTITDNMDPALRERADEYSESDELRGFFSEVVYRDPMTMRAHHYHWFDLARMRDNPHPSIIRSTPSSHNLFDGRAEGMATGVEEMLMHAGLYDSRPRGRELVWVMLAQRCARALGALKQHGLEMNFDQSTKIASKWTPWGLMLADGATIQGEEHFYLRQPAYGTSYVIGKIEIEKLLAEYARQHEENFKLKTFMDEYNSKGVIPISLIYWEMTGDKSMLEKALIN